MNIPDRYWTGKPLLDARLPWLTPGAVRALNRQVYSGQRVLELGCGGSTLFFSDRGCRVISWESNKLWAERIRKLLKNPARIVADLEQALLESGPSDWILIDNNDRVLYRPIAARRALPYLRSGGCLILDNYQRYPLHFLTGWDKTAYDDPRWDGKGTLLAKRSPAI